MRWCRGGFQRVEVGGLEAEGKGWGTGALALWGGGSGVLGVFLTARGDVFVCAEGAATLEMIAAWWCARLRFCDLGVRYCV